MGKWLSNRSRKKSNSLRKASRSLSLSMAEPGKKVLTEAQRLAFLKGREKRLANIEKKRLEELEKLESEQEAAPEPAPAATEPKSMMDEIFAKFVAKHVVESIKENQPPPPVPPPVVDEKPPAKKPRVRKPRVVKVKLEPVEKPEPEPEPAPAPAPVLEAVAEPAPATTPEPVSAPATPVFQQAFSWL